MVLKSKWQIVVWLVFLVPALAQGQNLESLAPNFLKRVVTLRNFYKSDLLRYDSSGTLIGSPEQGPWTIYGRLEINRLAVRKNKLEIGASRLLIVYGQKTGEPPRYIRWEPNTIIEIAVSPNTSLADVKKALGRVFMSSSEKFSDLVPSYWRSFFGGADPNATPKTPALPKENAIPNPASAPAPPVQSESEAALSHDPGPAASANEGPQIKVEKGIIPGHLIKQVRPLYPQLAKSARVSGAVILLATIKKDGSMGEIQIAQPVGAGLDEAAIEAVSQWKYQPYLLKGDAVEVETHITVNFVLGP